MGLRAPVEAMSTYRQYMDRANAFASGAAALGAPLLVMLTLAYFWGVHVDELWAVNSWVKPVTLSATFGWCWLLRWAAVGRYLPKDDA